MELPSESQIRKEFLSNTLTVKHCPKVGRYVVAARDLQEGETIMFAKPYLTNIKESFRKRVCANTSCLLIEDNGRLIDCCKGCGLAYYCSPACCERDKEKHGKVCQLMKKVHARKQKFGEPTCVLLMALLRVWLSIDERPTATQPQLGDFEVYDPETVVTPVFSDFMQLCSHADSWSPDKLKRMEKPLTFLLALLKEEGLAAMDQKTHSTPLTATTVVENVDPATPIQSIISATLSPATDSATVAPPSSLLSSSCSSPFPPSIAILDEPSSVAIHTPNSLDTPSPSSDARSESSQSSRSSRSASRLNQTNSKLNAKLARLPVQVSVLSEKVHLKGRNQAQASSSSSMCLSLTSGSIPTYEDLLGWVSRIESNSFAAVCAKNREAGEQLAIGAAMFNHSCSPNVMAEDCDATSMQAIRVVTTAAVRAGEELFLSYIPLDLPLSARQNLLKACYNFTCACVRCEKEGESKEKVTYSRSKNNHKITRLKPKLAYELA